MRFHPPYYHIIFLFLLILVPTAACGSQTTSDPVAAEEVTISVSGAFALFPLMTIWADAYHGLHTQVSFDVQAGGAGKGMTDVLSGMADIAMLSREPRQEELDQGAFVVPVTIDSVLGTINATNPYLDSILQQGITPEEANGIWITRKITTWGQLLGNGSTDPIDVYTRADASGAAEMWALFSLGDAQEALIGTAVNGDPGVAEAVRQDTLGIGFNNVGFIYNQETGQPIAGLQAIPVDLDGDGRISANEAFYDTRSAFTAAVADGRYPFPPARTLYLVTKGTPNPTIIDFYRWILSDGQAYVTDAGYVTLTDTHIQEALEMVGE